MTILFISSGNSGDISPIVKAQGESLKKFGVSVEYFIIQGKGVKGYSKNALRLRKHLKTKKYDVVHAHFVFSAYVATLAGAKPLVVSLMGSDTAKTGVIKIITRFLLKNVWGFTLVKSEKMKAEIGFDDLLVLPNGVNFTHFKPFNREEAIAKIGWNPQKRHVLFGSSPSRPEKNFDLAQKAFNALNLPNIELKTLENVPFEIVPYYYSAADVVLLTSHREGSPNVIKEAMACSRPIVVTPVGDVQKVIGDTAHCHIVDAETDKVAAALSEILSLPYLSTDGRQQISWLNQDEIALKLIEIYKGLQR